ncbi:hypothetical protein [Devosia sp. 1566]|uniref:hypothetical protein n=1 Tax=Devosia sp. 1566 TaxID=2499144 RepID=UPI000FDCBE4A|nr:hypothetical protein [Devosia sp. 1566]
MHTARIGLAVLATLTVFVAGFGGLQAAHGLYEVRAISSAADDLYLSKFYENSVKVPFEPDGTASIGPQQADFPRTVYFRGSPGSQYVLMKDGFSRPFTLDENGRAAIDTAQSGVFSLERLIFLLVLSVLAGTAVAAARLPDVRFSWKTDWPLAVAGLILGLKLVAFYPGFFTSDTILGRTNAGEFVTWYSPVYALYTKLVMPLGTPHLILGQLVFSTLFLLVLVLGWIKTGRKGGVVASFALLVIVALSPQFTAVQFVSQRYFLAPAVVLLAIAVFFVASATGATRARFWWFTVLIGLAVALRAEYALLLLVMFPLCLRLYSRRLVATGAAASVAMVLALNFAVPALYKAGEGSEYALTVLADIAHPYACAPGHPDIVSIFAELGPVETLCAAGPENFFWDFVSARPAEEQLKATRELRNNLPGAIAQDPVPAVWRALYRTAVTLGSRTWQIVDKYARRDTPDFHMAKSDSFAAVQEYQPEWLHRAVLAPIRALSGSLTNILPLSAFIVLLALSFRHAPNVYAITAAMGVIAAVCILVSPTANWAYVGAPFLWGAFGPFFYLIEVGSRRHRAGNVCGPRAEQSIA